VTLPKATFRLGLDVLHPAFDLKAFEAVFGSSKRDLKSVLMDQHLMAGLGNILFRRNSVSSAHSS